MPLPKLRLAHQSWRGCLLPARSQNSFHQGPSPRTFASLNVVDIFHVLFFLASGALGLANHFLFLKYSLLLLL